MSLDLREFGEADWAAWSGANSFSDGTAPLVGEVTVEGYEATIIVDADPHDPRRAVVSIFRDEPLEVFLRTFYPVDIPGVELREYGRAYANAFLRGDVSRERLAGLGFD